jgi:penicillin amidase
VISHLLTVEPEGWRQERTTEMLKKWDCDISDNSESAAVYAVYQLELARAAFADELGPELFRAYVARTAPYQAALDEILQDPRSPWWDDVTTPQRESRADILQQAYEPALEWIGRNHGDLHLLWEWNKMHGSQLRHVLGNGWPWDVLLNHDFTPDGWTYTNNASPGGLTSSESTKAIDIYWQDQLYQVRAVYGYRQIIDPRDPATVWFILLPGQSGHPFHPNYKDLAQAWSAGRYQALHLAPSPDDVAGAAGRLRLVPEKR